MRGGASVCGSRYLAWTAAVSRAGNTFAIADCNLFFADPATTWSLPAIIASMPSWATSTGSSFGDSSTLVPCIPARSKNLVSVGPGISAVTVTPLCSSS